MSEAYRPGLELARAARPSKLQRARARRLAQAQADRAQRIASMGPGQNLALRATTVEPGAYTGQRKHKRPGGDKGQGLWRTVGMHFKTTATIDRRWDATRRAPVI